MQLIKGAVWTAAIINEWMDGMKKTIIKLSVFILTFIISLIVISKVMNQGNNNLTTEMSPAQLPVITMVTDGIAYNQLHGYKEAMDVAFQRDCVTYLGSGREVVFRVDSYGASIDEISIEVRSRDGGRLIENSPVKELTTKNGQIEARITLKDLIEPEEEYALVILLRTGEETVRYYTRIISSDSLYGAEKLNFVMDFHNKLYDKESARELTKYLESNSQGDNSSYHKVNIHSSFQQITWGELNVTEVTVPVIRMAELTGQTASILLDYIVSTTEERTTTYYTVEEYYRVRYTTDRMYLLDYERTMTQIPNVEGAMYANDKILLGIVDENVMFRESEDGNIILFEVANRLFSYNVTTNKLTVLFSFYDQNNADSRTLYQNHGIKLLDVDEGGNVRFAVYGYMNRGRHEGELGIQIYYYDSTLNTVEEAVYIPSSKSYAILKEEMDQLLYLNRENELYIFLENIVYGVSLNEKTYERIVEIDQDNSMQVSDNHKILVWQMGEDIYHSDTLVVKNLNNKKEQKIQADSGEAIMPLGFMGEDVIYGVARNEDIETDNTGRIFYPMYKVCISNPDGDLLKEYSQENIYVTGCSVENNQITLEQVRRISEESYEETEQGHITNNLEKTEGKNQLITAVTERYKKFMEIQTTRTIDNKSIKILTPKEVVFEGGRELDLEPQITTARYYVYGPYGVEGIFNAPSRAVELASAISGVAVGGKGEIVWRKGTRSVRNQIMAIKEPEMSEGQSSLAVCLDTILKYEGMVRDSQSLLNQGRTAVDILEESLENVQMLDLTGCSLDAVLYYVSQDIPVLATLKNGEAVLLVGYNELQIGIMDPVTGLYKKGINDTAEWFEENGNCFITFIRQ